MGFKVLRQLELRRLSGSRGQRMIWAGRGWPSRSRSAKWPGRKHDVELNDGEQGGAHDDGDGGRGEQVAPQQADTRCLPNDSTPAARSRRAPDRRDVDGKDEEEARAGAQDERVEDLVVPKRARQEARTLDRVGGGSCGIEEAAKEDQQDGADSDGPRDLRDGHQADPANADVEAGRGPARQFEYGVIVAIPAIASSQIAVRPTRQ